LEWDALDGPALDLARVVLVVERWRREVERG
jgi:hypothetical protein